MYIICVIYATNGWWKTLAYNLKFHGCHWLKKLRSIYMPDDCGKDEILSNFSSFISYKRLYQLSTLKFLKFLYIYIYIYVYAYIYTYIYIYIYVYEYIYIYIYICIV